MGSNSNSFYPTLLSVLGAALAGWWYHLTWYEGAGVAVLLLATSVIGYYQVTITAQVWGYDVDATHWSTDYSFYYAVVVAFGLAYVLPHSTNYETVVLFLFLWGQRFLGIAAGEIQKDAMERMETLQDNFEAIQDPRDTTQSDSEEGASLPAPAETNRMFGPDSDVFFVDDISTSDYPLGSSADDITSTLRTIDTRLTPDGSVDGVLRPHVADDFLLRSPEGSDGAEAWVSDRMPGSDAGGSIAWVGGRKGVLLGDGVACIAGVTKRRDGDLDWDSGHPCTHTHIYSYSPDGWALVLAHESPLYLNPERLPSLYPDAGDAVHLQTNGEERSPAPEMSHEDNQAELDREDILHLEESLVERADTQEALDELMDPKARFLALDGDLYDRDRVLDLGSSGNEVLDGALSARKVHPIGDRHMAVTGLETTKTTEMTYVSGYTSVFRKRDDAWKLAFAHDLSIAQLS